MEKVLVVGGAGYIGSHTAKALKLSGYEVIVYDNLSTGNKSAVKFGEFVYGELEDYEKLDTLFTEHQFLAVFHFAGSIKVPESVENPEKYYFNNSQNSLNLISLCRKHNIQNFIFSSTAAVYGELPTGKAYDGHKTEPINPYGRSKLMTEWMLEDFSKAYDLNYVALRYFNVCGADPDCEIGQAFPEPFHLINVACEAATGKREKMYIFGEDYPTEDGTCIRDYIHVSDLADAHALALKFLRENKESKVLNCGYGHGYSVKQIIDSVKKVTSINFKVESAQRRSGDPAVLIAESSKIKELFHWKPRFDDIDKIIETTYKWESSETLKKWREEKSL